ncbi:MAG: helix-turn-helix domain-containing protein, partial [Solirubrobacteraceae bacterium]
TAAAATDLHVHANTVRYRLRQATEVAGLRLTDGDARLALELELRAWSADPPDGLDAG